MFKDLYEVTQDGVIHQKVYERLMTYDSDYISQRYVKYGYYNDEMSYLRYGFLNGAIRGEISSILDVGYGNGSFLNVCSSQIKNCYGFDITGYPLPDKVTQVDNIYEGSYDVVCFFDVLEHLHDIDVIRNIKTKYLFISVPWCHFFSEEWFMEWKHRRFDEHLWHFNHISLDNFMKRMGFHRIIGHFNIEDSIRKSPFPYQNILTTIYEKI